MNQENPNPQFVVCVDNSNIEASLEFGKIYRVIPDADAENEGLLRIIDESGEDYGFTASRFFPVQLPAQLEQMLSVAY
ncbi:MAG: hypothetical protein LH614_18120 [Pyrinomonadaceae bacterium]|nr:hypothetical protein [Pyrinomonadaceae bacterium]